MHPTCVWTCAALPNGDIVSGSGDGVVRVWTRDPARFATTEEASVYEASLASDIASGAVGADISKVIAPQSEFPFIVFKEKAKKHTANF